MPVDSGPRSEQEVLAAAVRAIDERLPETWHISTVEPAISVGDVGYDAELRLRTPRGDDVIFVVEVKSIVQPRDVGRLREQLDAVRAQYPGASCGLVAARYLSNSTRQRLQQAGLSYVDAAGNMMVRADDQALYISAAGADTDPWRGPGRPRSTLDGEPAAKVVRALLDFRGPWKIRHLIEVAEVATGSAYRVLDFLEREALIVRARGGEVIVRNWPELLRRWTEDYQFLHTNTVTRWIAPRGLPSFLKTLNTSEVGGYALTGSIAAATWQSYAPPRSAMVYVTDPEKTAKAWHLRSTDTGANVLLAVPAYPVLLARSREGFQDLMVAAPTQVVADLMTGPGRAPSEAQELLNWMENNERSWRRD